jgi:DNA-directed RNA polymerase II subunit RPB11
MSGINAPERSQLWLLPDGEKKMTYEKDSKLANAGIFVLKKEDHTMGNLLRM